jgi:alkaline phosphatase D
VLHLGDYLYEYAPGEYGYGQSNTDIRPHVPPHEMVTLADYRRRHGQYKIDPFLAALHAKAAWVTTWDDHELTNDAYRRGAENHDPATEGDFLARRRASHRAYDEWMPIRMSGTSALGDGTRIYRGLQFGQLADLSMLDLRTCRNKQVGPDYDGIDDPDRTITGDAQMRWLKQRLANNDAQWKLVGNPVMIAPVKVPSLPDPQRSALLRMTGTGEPGPEDGAPYNVDQWDGYAADRRELLRHLVDRGITDTVFLTGDIHSSWACDLPLEPGNYPLSRSVATELVCTSVTSNNLDDITGSPPRTTSLAVEEAIKTGNRHVQYVNLDDHGYSVLDVTPARVQMDYFKISDRADRDATSSLLTSWAVEAGTQQVAPAAGPIR